MAIRRKSSAPVRPGRERGALAEALLDAGHRIDAACGTCGGNVRADDPKAVQTWRAGPQPIPYVQSKSVSWRFHGGACDLIRRTLAPERDRLALAAMLDPSARPLTVDRAVAEVAAELGGPLLYCEVPGTTHTDQARGAWRHVGKVDRVELTQAVNGRREEIAREGSDIPCGLCGTAPLPPGPPTHGAKTVRFKGRRVCQTCAGAIRTSTQRVGRHLDLDWLALPALADRHTWAEPVVPAADHPSFGPVDGPRAPWGHLRQEPIPLTPEERLAAVEAKLVGAAS